MLWKKHPFLCFHFTSTARKSAIFLFFINEEVLCIALIYLDDLEIHCPVRGRKSGGERVKLKGMSQAGDKPLPSSRSSSDNIDGQVLPHSPPPYIQQREDHEEKRGHSLNGGEAGVAKYRECQKNHAAAIGGNARDGCGEFMPSGEEGTLNALKCSACNCHRNFHRREMVAVPPSTVDTSRGLTLRLLKSDPLNSPTDNGGDETHKVEIVGKKKRRYRTRFTAQQKEKMLAFATKAGWRMQKLDEHAVERFCQELGIERRVLKVWMHNNKHNYLPSKR